MNIGYGIAGGAINDCRVMANFRSFTTQENANKDDIYMIKLAADGDIIWQTVLSGLNPSIAEVFIGVYAIMSG